MENKYLKIFRLITMLSGIVFVLLVLSAWIGMNWFQEWKIVQKDYQQILSERAKAQNNPDLIDQYSIKIHQISLDDFSRVDRCVTCHQGMEDQGMEPYPVPHKTHSGDHLKDHAVQKYGCTICHGGQGRALTRKEAVATDPGVYWYFPMLSYPYIQSSCGKCHSALYSEQDKESGITEGMEIFLHGQNIFSREGCLGCHKARNVGGTVGTDLTTQGDKTRHEYNFDNIEGEESIANWLKEHFKDPEMVSPGSEMLGFNLEEEELVALATFSMGLSRPQIPFEYLSTETLKEFKGDRVELEGSKSYALFCTACHGKKGEGKDYLKYSTGIPAVFNRDFQSVASEDFIRFTIDNGRSNKQMASWISRFSGITEAELSGLTEFISSQQTVNNSLKELTLEGANSGNWKDGEILFEENCVMCHGVDARGGVALGFNKPGFFEAASIEFIFNTVHEGRKNTAMPSWAYLNMNQMNNLMAYIRSFSNIALTTNRVSLDVGNIEQGKLSFHYLCSRCHGEFGQGSTGPAIINKGFLDVASDYFLYKTISAGRSYTAMHGWSKNIQGSDGIADKEISDIIAYLRSEPYLDWEYIYPGAVKGDENRGSDLFQNHCSECHGKNGEGDNAPAVNNQEFLNAATNGYIMAAITLGRKNTRMPSWGRGSEDYPALSGEKREDLVAFLRAYQKVRIKR